MSILSRSRCHMHSAEDAPFCSVCQVSVDSTWRCQHPEPIGCTRDLCDACALVCVECEEHLCVAHALLCADCMEPMCVCCQTYSDVDDRSLCGNCDKAEVERIGAAKDAEEEFEIEATLA